MNYYHNSDNNDNDNDGETISAISKQIQLDTIWYIRS